MKSFTYSAAITLGVQERRIYDITNIFEGIDYVGKMQKNMIRWGYREDTKLERENFELRLELDRIAAEESRVESYFRILNQQIAK